MLSFHLYYGKLPDVKVYTLAHLQLNLWVNKALVPMLYSSNELLTLLFKYWYEKQLYVMISWSTKHQNSKSAVTGSSIYLHALFFTYRLLNI